MIQKTTTTRLPLTPSSKKPDTNYDFTKNEKKPRINCHKNELKSGFLSRRDDFRNFRVNERVCCQIFLQRCKSNIFRHYNLTIARTEERCPVGSEFPDSRNERRKMRSNFSKRSILDEYPFHTWPQRTESPSYRYTRFISHYYPIHYHANNIP